MVKSIRKAVVLSMSALFLSFPYGASAFQEERPLVVAKSGYLRLGENMIVKDSPIPVAGKDMSMVCKGTCMVKGSRVQIVAEKDSIFAISPEEDNWNMSVKVGTIHFAVKDKDTILNIQTPQDSYSIYPEFTKAGSAEGITKGTITVTENGTATLKMKSGVMRVVNAEGSAVVEEGKEIVLAQAQMPRPVTPTIRLPEPKPQTTSASLTSGVPSTPVLIGAGILGAGTVGWAGYEFAKNRGKEASPF